MTQSAGLLMVQTHIRLGELDIAVTFKAVKNVHLSVHPPEGAVTLVAPMGTRLEVARAHRGHQRITLHVRPSADVGRREAIYQHWQRYLLHETIPPLIAHWERRIGVKVEGYFLQRMKTKWGSCNHPRAHIQLNTELIKKPRDLFEYVIVHEMIHLLEPTHSERFIALLDQHYPAWREARAELNALPLGQAV